MRNRFKLILLLCLPQGACLLCCNFVAAQSPVPRVERDQQQENAVGNLFDDVRKEANLHRLSRIDDRTSLQQLVCTVAVTGNVPRFRSGFPVLGNDSIDGVTNEKQGGNSAAKVDRPGALYKTNNPGELTQELKRVALFERPRGRDGHMPGYARYSVAVWPAPTANGKAEYWIGIQLFGSEGNELFQNHFTDAMEWKNEWKQFVTPECKDVK